MLAFNKARAKFYPYNEVYLEAPKKAINLPEGYPTKHQYVRLDSYNPHTGEIVSRKYIPSLVRCQRRLQFKIKLTRMTNLKTGEVITFK